MRILSGLLLVWLCATCRAADAGAVTVETLAYRVAEEGSGAEQGSMSSEIRREPGRVHVTEDRKQKGSPQKFDVTFDAATLQPVSWTRITGEGDAATRTEVRVADGKIESKTYAGETLKNSASVAMPASPFCIAPMFKFSLAQMLDKNSLPSALHNVNVTSDGSLKVADGKVEDLGKESVTTPAGKFECRHLRVTAKSAMISALMPPLEMYLAADGTHPMVKLVMAPSRMSANIVTELQAYKVEQVPAK